MALLGLDYGDKTIGVALCAASERVAMGYTTLRRPAPEALRKNLKALKALVREKGITAIILGYPLSMDGSLNERCTLTMAFKEKLERYIKSVPVILWDERLSTQGAARAFDGRRKRYDAYVDEMAAAYILQGYLDYKDMEEQMRNENDTIITLFDDEGNEAQYETLAAQKKDGNTYFLLADMTDDDEAEVYHYKCILSDEEEMTFELIDEEHEEFESMAALFKSDYEELGIEFD